MTDAARPHIADADCNHCLDTGLIGLGPTERGGSNVSGPCFYCNKPPENSLARMMAEDRIARLSSYELSDDLYRMRADAKAEVASIAAE